MILKYILTILLNVFCILYLEKTSKINKVQSTNESTNDFLKVQMIYN